MPTYLFSVGLVPVQSWIAEARRARDLRAGSVFLWWTMAKLLAYLQQEHQAEILLPQARSSGEFERLAAAKLAQALEESYGIPNRAAGYLSAENQDEVRDIFSKLRKNVLLHAWQSFKEDNLAEELPRLAGKLWHDSLKAPVERYLERTRNGHDCPLSLLWVAQAVAERGEAREDLKQIERLFADLKRTRPVEAWRNLAGPVGKCNQCGRREAIGPDGDFTAWQGFHQALREDPWVRRGVRIDEGERLCYVCLARRLAGYAGSPRFRSTGEVAAHHWERRLIGEPRRLFEELKRGVEKVEYGGGDFYRALHASDRKLEGFEQIAGKRRALVQGIGEWNSSHPGEPITKEPPSYLAVLTFDGDSMGPWIPDNFPHGPERLNKFAQAAHEVLEGYGAAIFYLAGDEGLAMLPAASALTAALKLREEFKKLVAEGMEKPSLSAGLAFFEQSRPMAGAIRAARFILQSAKELDKSKNALGAAVETASGSRWRFVEHWGQPWERIQRIVGLASEKTLSAGWAYDVERFLSSLPLDSCTPERWGDDRLRAAVLAEVERLFVRRLSSEVGKTPEKRLLWKKLEGPGWWQRRSAGEVPDPHPEEFHLIGFLASHAESIEAKGGEPEP